MMSEAFEKQETVQEMLTQSINSSYREMKAPGPPTDSTENDDDDESAGTASVKNSVVKKIVSKKRKQEFDEILVMYGLDPQSLTLEDRLILLNQLARTSDKDAKAFYDIILSTGECEDATTTNNNDSEASSFNVDNKPKSVVTPKKRTIEDDGHQKESSCPEKKYPVSYLLGPELSVVGSANVDRILPKQNDGATKKRKGNATGKIKADSNNIGEMEDLERSLRLLDVQSQLKFQQELVQRTNEEYVQSKAMGSPINLSKQALDAATGLYVPVEPSKVSKLIQQFSTQSAKNTNKETVPKKNNAITVLRTNNQIIFEV